MSQRIDYQVLAEDYARHRSVNPEVLRRLLGLSNPTMRVLEVGCGTGNYISAVRDLKGCECVAIDPSTAMLAELGDRGNGVHFLLGRAETLEFDSESFDLVFSVDVIHHVTDRFAAFREAFRVLRPGGRLCTVTDSEWVIRHREPLSVYFPETVQIELERYPRIAALKSAMEIAGFDELQEDLAEAPYELADSAPYRDKAFSSLLLLDAHAFRTGLERLEEDLAAGPVQCTSRYTLLTGTKSFGSQVVD